MVYARFGLVVEVDIESKVDGGEKGERRAQRTQTKLMHFILY
jgi:hypothetical protein